MKFGSRLGSLVFSIAVFTLTLTDAFPQNYPTKPIRFIVPFPPGGPTDTIARIVGQKLTESWGQPVVIDNRGGASGNIGAEIASKSPPDGYTLFLVASNFPINVSLFSKLPYDLVKDFEAVINMAYTPYILVVHPTVPAKSVKELIALAKSKPGQLNYASASTGSANHLAMELFKTMAGVDMVHIPYKGAAPATTDLLGGQVALMFNNMISALPHIKSGKLRALAVTSAKRSPAVPDVPTVAESGLPGFEVIGWYGVLVPAKTIKEIVTKLNNQIDKIVHMPDVIERLFGIGVEPTSSTPEEFDTFIKDEITKWAKVVKASGARLD